jgi:isocitrate dehydrogenase
MFEAIHGSAPTIAGQNIANPSGIIQGAVLMLTHIGQADIAEKIQNALLKTIEDGVHTADVYNEAVSKKKVGTKEFALAVIGNLGQKPTLLKPVSYANSEALKLPKYKRRATTKKELVGVDVFVHWQGLDANELAEKLKPLNSESVALSMITNRGIKVWPEGFKETFCTDHWRCRFKPTQAEAMDKKTIVHLLSLADEVGIDVIKTVKMGLKGVFIEIDFKKIFFSFT